ncbi:malto-oligosyltrehalose synthase [Rhodocytophaga rosea]|uniref:Malto-oligosyltrehalose synthase n=1 Tax=Rhodocytophaga rosea TaxID=2704465 RepID=A0A6C0GNB4_9BACT|nr:malto-oligosyltrehalose synthase [Rhodocytophaga rosea]QHT69526.1 malto-oligosyltrehalose synthase [Rhodocytophaga rosea]
MQVPLSTYRIQFHKEFTFQSAQQITKYLHKLGIKALYASPIFKAPAGSTHGYDVADPNQINPEVGTLEELQELSQALKEKNIGWLQDIVPNHMVFSPENGLLMDLLEKGYASPYSKHFDIAWNHPNETLKRRLLVPFLGSPYYEVLKNGELQFQYQEGTFQVAYYDNIFPLRIESYPVLLGTLADTETNLEELSKELVAAFAQIAAVKGEERVVQMEQAKQALWEAYSHNAEFKTLIEAQLSTLNADMQKMHDLLSVQHFRLAYWRLANREINYRRFFNINQLISIRVEDPAVLSQTHQLIFNLLQQGVFTGVRIDHIDGLNDPLTYLQQLRSRAKDAYIVVEKILEAGEELPEEWPIEGTSGYDFLTQLNDVFCERAHKEDFQELFTRFTGQEFYYDALLYEKKRFILQRLFVGDLEKLFLQFKKLSFYLPEGVDILQADLRQALGILLSCFPVYRTYVNSSEVSDRDRHYIEEALEKAGDLLAGQELTLQFLRKILLMEFPPNLGQLKKANWIKAVMQFQQISGPLMAKGLEDTAFYIYNRLLSLNEVGGNPEAFGCSVEEFHHFNLYQLQHWPYKINATATHDTKRGEDVRARLNVLSEIPGEWEKQVRQWHKINQPVKQKREKAFVPDRNEEYMLYQALLGSWPFETPLPDDFAQRLEGYLLKALKEAKVHSSWSIPDEQYEQAILKFSRKLLDPAQGFLKAFLPFQQKIASYGIFNSLSQVLLKITSPGVPDIYQGCELWDLSMVDPDNRRPVDYSLRKQYLDFLQQNENDSAQLISELLSSKEDGRIKMYVLYKTLQVRNQYAALFDKGVYLPLEVSGKQKDCVIAFARVSEENIALVVAPRFYTRLMAENELHLGEKAWANTAIHLPDGKSYKPWKQIFTGSVVQPSEKLYLKDICKEFPLGLLTNQ